MKTKMTITMIIICLFIRPANATVVFDDGLVHNVDWLIWHDVYVGFYNPGPGPPPELSSLNTNITTVNFLSDGGVTGTAIVTSGGIMNIEGGTMLFGALGVLEYGEATMSDGLLFGSLYAMGGGEPVVITGGYIGGMIRVSGGRTVNIVGTDFAVNGVPVDCGSSLWLRGLDLMFPGYEGNIRGTLTGTLSNGDPMYNYFYIFKANDGLPQSDIILTESVPEPATLLLLGFGGLMLKYYRKKRSYKNEG